LTALRGEPLRCHLSAPRTPSIQPASIVQCLCTRLAVAGYVSSTIRCVPVPDTRAQFFTPQGKPTKPYCNKGDHCRSVGSHSPHGCHIDSPSGLSYLHPNDANWNSADRYKPSAPTFSAPFSAPKASRMRTRTSSSTPLRPIRHSSPLVSQSDLFKLNADDNFSQARTPRSGNGYDEDGYGERMRQPKYLDRSDSRHGKRLERRFDSGSSSYSKPSTSRFVRDFWALLFCCVLIRIVSRIRNRATGTSHRTRRSMTRIKSGPRFNLQNVIEPLMKSFPGIGSFPPKIRLITPG
jgi:hypothetical protein